MAQTYQYDGNSVTAVRGGTVELNECADAGRVGNSTLTIEDPDGDLEILGHKTFRVHQDECSVLNVLRGFVTSREYQRAASERTGNARHINLQIVDLNAKLGFKIIRGSAWRKRPRETIGERLTDLLASSFMNGVHDNGFVAYPDMEIDGGDLRGQYPGDVLSDMGEAVGFNWFVYWDEDETQASLWFQDSNTSTDWSSSLRISDVIADVDGVTTFAPSFDTKLTRSPERTISGVWMPFKRGNVYRTREATEENYEPRDGTATNANVKRRAKARNRADRYLRTHANEEDVITTTMRDVPDDKVNLIRAGQRIECKFTSFTQEGYGDFTWMRVMETTKRLLDTRPVLYDIDMTLSPQEAGLGTVGLVQYKGVTHPSNSNLTLDNDVTIGHLLVSVLVQLDASDAPEMVAGHGWTKLGEAFAVPDGSVSDREGAVAIWAKVADSTSPFMERESTAARMQMWVYELAGATIEDAVVLDASNVLVNTASAFTADLGSFTGPGVGISGWTFTQTNPGAGQTITLTFDTGWTKDFGDYVDPSAFGNPWAAVGHSELTDETALNPAINADETVGGQGVYQWAGVAVMFE